MKISVDTTGNHGYKLTINLAEYSWDNIVQMVRFIKMGESTNWGSYKCDYNDVVKYHITETIPKRGV